MDSTPPKDSEKAAGAKQTARPAIESLRTVEFRTTIRGYHMDDVDEYLEKVAVEAEALQEQVRLSTDRLKQAGDRVSGLEQQLEAARRAQSSVQSSAPVERHEPAPVTDDSLQRTLVLAQKFVDQTKTEAEEEARALVAEAEARARNILSDAEEHVRVMTEEAERNVREEVKKLASQKSDLVSDVETIARHLEAERSRIRTALTDMLAWVDDHVQPPGPRDASTASGPGQQATGTSPAQSPGADASRATRIETMGADPTELVTADRKSADDSGEGGDSAYGSIVSDGTTDAARGTSERTAPSHQRQMFAPGRDPHQAPSGAVR